MQRDSLRAEYGRFCKSWQAERRYQDYMVENKYADIVEEKDGLTYLVSVKDDVRQQLLGHKPTFRMWLQAKKNKLAADQRMKDDKKHIEVSETSWDDVDECLDLAVVE